MLPLAYPDEFTECVELVLKAEGGYSNDPKDAGGPTKYGISQRAFPKLKIKTLTRKEAIQIYYTHYWQPLKPDLIPAHLRYAVFDCAVNCGVRKAIQLLQILGGAHVDGVNGPVTASKAKDISLDEYLAIRKAYYGDIVKARPSQKKFYSGWLIRLRNIRAVIKRLTGL